MHATMPGDFLTLRSVASSNLPEVHKTGIARMYEKMTGSGLVRAQSNQVISKASKWIVGGGSIGLGVVLGAIEEKIGLDVEVQGHKIPVDGVAGFLTLMASGEMGEYEDHGRLLGALGMFSAAKRKGREWVGGSSESSKTTSSPGEDSIAKAAANL